RAAYLCWRGSSCRGGAGARSASRTPRRRCYGAFVVVSLGGLGWPGELSHVGGPLDDQAPTLVSRGGIVPFIMAPPLLLVVAAMGNDCWISYAMPVRPGPHRCRPQLVSRACWQVPGQAGG